METSDSDRRVVVDANDAVARVAHLLSEVIAIYPITPASPMGEAADDRSARGMTNLWGTVPEVIEMQSEAGAAGTLHGAVTRGALGTTFTASQGLLLMLPNMFKIAGELTPTVIHVAARSIATHALSIFGDHSDVMAARDTGFAQLCASSVQESGDFAAVAHAATLTSRVPFLHFFDGFRTSHELNTIHPVSEDVLRALVDDDAIARHRLNGLDPDRPVLRGTAQNPDVFFQAREACTPFHAAVPDTVQATFDHLAELTGRAYHLVDYHGAPNADRVIVMMGSGVGAARQAVDALIARGEHVGLVTVRLYRPFPIEMLLGALPPTVRTIAVLDRTKEPGAPGEPLYQDVIASLWSAGTDRWAGRLPRVIGGRYGLSSKEFTPAMVAAVFANAAADDPILSFTVGIVDDISHSSLPEIDDVNTDGAATRAVFYGLGADGTVGANKNTTKIVGDLTDMHVQAYFVYDSKKAGSMTISHLRFDDDPIDSTYLINDATFVGVHSWPFFERFDVLTVAAEGATVLINSPYPADEVWDRLPIEAQESVLAKGLRLHTIDASKVAREAGLGGRINTIMQTAFFALSAVLPLDTALEELKSAIRATYGKRGEKVVERNVGAVDETLAKLHPVIVPDHVTTATTRRAPVPDGVDDFVARVTATMIAGNGDLLPVSALPPDGTFPTGTAKVEKRTIAVEIPIWEPDLCIDCGKCAIVCPHAAIRMKVFDPGQLADAPEGFLSKSFRSRDVPGMSLTIQVAPDDCTGCGVCVQACPAHDKSEVKRKSINMRPIRDHLDTERVRWDGFLQIESADVAQWEPDNVKQSQLREPLFEFSGACAGCGETPYLKLLTQLFGDRLIVANATGCSSIYGGNLPTTPWTTDSSGRGPAWSNSLFEDNAEFGLGIRLAYESQRDTALRLLRGLAHLIGAELASEIADGVAARDDRGLRDQRARIEKLSHMLDGIAANGASASDARRLLDLVSTLVERSVWIVGGDGWAYDIGAGGLDHVLGSGRDVNVLVLDTEVYSNTGGQASKATPRAAVAKFAAAGKGSPKKDLGMEALSYGDVYVAHVAMGANELQTVKAFREAEAWPGVSLIIAYSTCIAHGIDMSNSMVQQKQAVLSGHWPLFRYKPGEDEHTHPFQLDSKEPSVPFRDFAASEARFAMLRRSDPERAAELLTLAEADIRERWRTYEQLAGIERTVPGRLGQIDPSDADHSDTDQEDDR